MPRYKITIEYEGSDFVGWQRQDNGVAVQQVLEEAVERFCGETVTVFAAGRTDSGVHALGQVAHVDLGRDFATKTVRDAINFHLKPAPVAILDAERVNGDFHARFSARERVYRYRIANRRPPCVLERDRAWWVPVPLDEKAMAEAAAALIGRHDFSTFRAAQCQATSPLRTLDVLHIHRDGEEILVDVRARSFLHHQVRNMVGTLKLVGEGKWTPARVADALAARDRAAGGPTAPAHGLYLVEVVY
jgi:tRNA pseudouridine38-40 synthase